MKNAPKQHEDLTESKKVSVVSGIDPATDPTEQQERVTRVWRRITLLERLKLEITVSFGLPVDFAGKIIKMSSRNANRIMKDCKKRRQMEQDSLAFFPKSQRA